MQSLFEEDDIILSPSLKNLSDPDNARISMKLIEDFYDTSIFLNTNQPSDILVLDGNSNVILDGDEPSITYVKGFRTEISVGDGTHDVIMDGGYVNYSQSAGNTLIYFENILQTEGTIEIDSGSLTLVNGDDNFENLDFSVKDGFLEIGEVKTAIRFLQNEDGHPSIYSNNVFLGEQVELGNTDTNPKLLNNNKSISANPNNAEVYQQEHASNPIFSDADDDLSIEPVKFANSLPMNNSISANDSSLSLELEMSKLFSAIDIDIQSFSEQLKEGPTIFTENNIDEDSILEINDYSDLNWDDALDLLSEL